MKTEHMFAKRLAEVEKERDTEFVPESERNQNPSSLFFIWFGSNLTIGDFALGMLAAWYGMPLGWTFASVILGTLAGGILLAIMSVMGPKAGYPQMIIGKTPFGKVGGSIMSFLQWMNTTGWLVFNAIIAAAALALLTSTGGFITLGGISMGLYLIPILVVSVLVFLLALFGHGMVHRFEKAMSVIIGLLFLYITAVSFQKVSVMISYSPATLSATDLAFYFAGVFALSFSYIMSWGPYASDYSRYVKTSTSSTSVFGMTLAGSVLSTLWAEFAGIAIYVLVLPPDFANPAVPLQSFLGNFWYLGMITLLLGGLSANALNLYSNSLSFKGIGIKAKRHWILILTSTIAVLFAYFGYLKFAESYEFFLYLLDYWITPWLGIMIADFFIVNRGKFRESSERYNWKGIASYLVAVIVSIPFMNQSFNTILEFEGPVSTYLGGADISYFVSFFIAIILYTMVSRRFRAKELIGQAA